MHRHCHAGLLAQLRALLSTNRPQPFLSQLCCAVDIVPEYNISKPEEMAEAIDRRISLMRSMSVDPAVDHNLSIEERQRYMDEPPASRASIGASGMEGMQNALRGQQVEWLPYRSTKEKLRSWVQPDTNDSSSNRNLMRQMTKEERS